MNLIEKVKSEVNLDQYKGIKKVVLAYSGGLDTSLMVDLIPKIYGAEVITMTADLGQKEYKNEELKEIENKAIKLGAKKHYFVDLKKEFVEQYCWKALKANSLYMDAYPNSTAIARPLIVKYLVEIAKKENADAIAHGCTGKGNDQIRFDVSALALNPNLKIIAPVRDWNLKRNEEIEYANQNNIPVPVTKSSPYSVDANLWGRSSECGAIEHPDTEVPEDALAWVTPPEKAEDKAIKIKIYFEKGIPAKIEFDKNSETDGVKIVETLNKLAGSCGIGIIDHMEDRTVGLKSREYYECPAATVLLKAHQDLEKYTLTADELKFKKLVDNAWTEYTYKGLWYSPLMKALESFIDKTQEFVSGWVLLKLYKGAVHVLARNSKYALYDLNLSTYDTHTTWNQKDSLGFIKLWGMNTVLSNQVRKK